MNVIELGLQQAKVSPFPSISEILTESGIDLTGVTRPGRRSASGPAAGRPDAPVTRGRAGAPDGQAAAETFGDRAGGRARPAGHPYEPGWGAAGRRDSRYP